MKKGKKDLLVVMGLKPKGEGSEDEEKDGGDAHEVREKALKAFQTMCEAIKNDDYKAGLKAFCAVHGFDHALWDMDEDMADGEEDEEGAEEDLEDAED